MSPAAVHSSPSATIFSLPEKIEGRRPRDIWCTVQSALLERYPAKYRTHPSKHYELICEERSVLSRCKRYLRSRTLRAGVLLGSARRIELCAGNIYRHASDRAGGVVGLDEIRDVAPELSQWIRTTGAIPLDEHLAVVRETLRDLAAAGIELGAPGLSPIPGAPITFRSQGQELLFDGGSKRKLLLCPDRNAPTWTLGIAGEPGTDTRSGASRLSQEFERLFTRARVGPSKITFEDLDGESSVLLIVLDDQTDLQGGQWPERLRRLEADGRRFKLVNATTLKDGYAILNIVFDLFLLAGGLPWSQDHVTSVGMDAGHLVERRKSRWTAIRCNGEPPDIRIVETALAEHIPDEALAELLRPSVADKGVDIYRDGRLARESSQFKTLAAQQGNNLFEVKKHPAAVLFRGTLDSPQPPRFGDAVSDPNGSFLVQSTDPRPRDYAGPLRVSLALGSKPVDLALQDFLRLHAIPTLGLFSTPRLPGPLYWADAISKMTRDGWPKVIGREFGIPGVVPDSA